jgi:uncharacterized membrane protein YgcG
MKPLRKIALLLLVGLWTVTAVAQTDLCPAVVQQAIAETDHACQITNRNQACYGHISISAEPQPHAADFRFSQIGDIASVLDIRSLRLSSMDTNNFSWGVALLRIQANLPSTLPGQNVTMLVFGDTEIADAATSPALGITPAAGDFVSIRSQPQTDGSIMGSLASGASMMASGRTQDGSWLRVNMPMDNQIGWVYRPLVNGDSDVNALRVVKPDDPMYGPMQSFYLRTGIGAPRCAELPDSGILIQSPEGAGAIQLSINEVSIEMGSTLFFETNGTNDLVVSVVEGAAHVSSNGVTRPVVAGSNVHVPLDSALAPMGAPTLLEPYDAERMARLPIESLERDITIAPPITDRKARLVAQNEALFNMTDVHLMSEMLDVIASDLANTQDETDSDEGDNSGSTDARHSGHDGDSDGSGNGSGGNGSSGGSGNDDENSDGDEDSDGEDTESDGEHGNLNSNGHGNRDDEERGRGNRHGNGYGRNEEYGDE